MGWSLAEILSFAIALLLMMIAAVLLRLVPMRVLLRRLGTSVGVGAPVPLITPQQTARARLIKNAIRRAAMVTPLRSNCLPQALAGVAMGRIFGVPVLAHLGVKLVKVGDGHDAEVGDQGMLAHAWVCAGPVAVTGGYSFDEYVSVASFTFTRMD